MSTTVAQKTPTIPERPHWAGDLDALMEAYRQAGGDPEAIMQANIATLVVSKKELETLMSRGLDEDEAVDVIIRGMLT